MTCSLSNNWQRITWGSNPGLPNSRALISWPHSALKGTGVLQITLGLAIQIFFFLIRGFIFWEINSLTILDYLWIGYSYNHSFKTRENSFMLCLSLLKASFHENNPALSRYWRTDSSNGLRFECLEKLIDSPRNQDRVLGWASRDPW